MCDLRLLVNMSNPQCYNYGFKYLHASDNHSFLFCPSARQANKQHYGFAAQHASHWIKEQAAAGLNMKPEAAKDRRPKCNATSTSFKPNPSRGAPKPRANHRPQVPGRSAGSAEAIGCTAATQNGCGGEACRGGFKMGGAKLAKSARPERLIAAAGERDKS
jgi:hypothetical protein